MERLEEPQRYALFKQCVDCAAHATKPFSDVVNEKQLIVNALRLLYQNCVEADSTAIAASVSNYLQTSGISLEAGPDEMTGNSELLETLHSCFRTTAAFLNERQYEDHDGLKAAASAVGRAQITLEILVKNPLHQEWKTELTGVLREFNAAVEIAKSDDMTITREAALEIVDARGQGIE